MKMMRTITVNTVTLAVIAGLMGCAGMSAQDRNTAIGAGVGAVGGAALTGGSALGTVGGAAVGGVVGHEIGDKKNRK
ncbi:MAG: glycine zipper 2TM domain-containing protein [Nitrosomonas sp.]